MPFAATRCPTVPRPRALGPALVRPFIGSAHIFLHVSARLSNSGSSLCVLSRGSVSRIMGANSEHGNNI